MTSDNHADNELTEKDISNILYACLSGIQGSLNDINKTLNETNDKQGQINQQLLNRYVLETKKL